MPYTPSTGWATLKSAKALEKAMRERNVNGSELARLAQISPQAVSNIRRSRYGVIRQDIAAALERALGVGRGVLFDYTPRRQRVAS